MSINFPLQIRSLPISPRADQGPAHSSSPKLGVGFSSVDEIGPASAPTANLGIEVDKLEGQKVEINLLQPFFQRGYEHLTAIFVGQDKACFDLVYATQCVVERRNAPVTQRTRPRIGAALFHLGPTGVGKSDIAKEWARYLGAEVVLEKGGEYKDKSDVPKLIGSAAKYQGSTTPPRFNNERFDKAKAPGLGVVFVVFDELEKADVSVDDALMEAMETGVFEYTWLERRNGDEPDKTHYAQLPFDNVILVATSNCGSEEWSAEIREAESKQEFKPSRLIGFDPGNLSRSALKDTKAPRSAEERYAERVRPHLLKRFRPEYLNRYDTLQYFNFLDIEAIKEILPRRLKAAVAELKEQFGAELDVELTANAKKLLFEKCKDIKNGARPTRRAVDGLSDLLRSCLSSGSVKVSDKITVGVVRNEETQELELGIRKLPKSGLPPLRFDVLVSIISHAYGKGEDFRKADAEAFLRSYKSGSPLQQALCACVADKALKNKTRFAPAVVLELTRIYLNEKNAPSALTEQAERMVKFFESLLFSSSGQVDQSFVLELKRELAKFSIEEQQVLRPAVRLALFVEKTITEKAPLPPFPQWAAPAMKLSDRQQREAALDRVYSQRSEAERAEYDKIIAARIAAKKVPPQSRLSVDCLLTFTQELSSADLLDALIEAGDREDPVSALRFEINHFHSKGSAAKEDISLGESYIILRRLGQMSVEQRQKIVDDLLRKFNDKDEVPKMERSAQYVLYRAGRDEGSEISMVNAREEWVWQYASALKRDKQGVRLTHIQGFKEKLDRLLPEAERKEAYAQVVKILIPKTGEPLDPKIVELVHQNFPTT